MGSIWHFKQWWMHTYVKTKQHIKGFFDQYITLFVNELHVEEFFISFDILFQIIGPEYEMLSLNILWLCFGILKFWLETDRKDAWSKLSNRLWNKSQTYWGMRLFSTLNIIFALFTNALCSNDSIFNLIFAFSKSKYSFPKISLNARFWSFVTLDKFVWWFPPDYITVIEVWLIICIIEYNFVFIT